MRIRAFQGLVPVPARAPAVACVPYDVVDATEAAALAAGRPESLLHVDRAEIDLPAGTDPYSDAVYAKARDNFLKLQDTGVLVPRDPVFMDRTWKVGDEFIVEWRALTVALLDELAPRVRKQLNRTEAELPLACVLEGGSWATGRALAQRLRDGAPPIQIESDGTVF